MKLRKVDSKNMFNAIINFPKNIDDALKIAKKFKFKSKYYKIDNVVISGMGGSAIGGDIVSALGKENIDIPLTISRNYTLPNWVGKNSLVICSSYSGNTEETLSCLEDALKKNAQICGITTGGILKSKLNELNKDVFITPSGLQPRAALAYSLIPISKILEKLDVLKIGFDIWLDEFLKNIKDYQTIYCLEGQKNPTYDLARKIYKKIPIIYADNSTLSVVATRMKGQISENSKMLAYQNDLPELNHNEIVGWENNLNILNNLAVIWLKDESDHERNKYRQNITKNILDKINIKQFSVKVEGNSFQERFLHMLHFGDWLSYWCAMLHKTDPNPVFKIDRLKNSLESL